jgi:hypothetical protein
MKIVRSIDLSILVVSFNTRELTLACLRSVFEQTRGLAFEVLVVENASTDGSGPAIAEKFPQVTLIQQDANLGFAAANNLASQQARGDLLLLLNPDTVVLDGAIQKLVEFSRQNLKAGIWGGRTIFADGSLNPTSCWRRPTLWSTFCRGVGLSTIFRRSRIFNPDGYGSWRRDCVSHVDIVTGCLLLISRELWQRLGGFDPAFFMYGEEVDLCLRARTLGCRPMITPQATIVHYGGASDQARADKLCMQAETKLQLIRRHWSRPAAKLGVAFVLLETATRAVGLWLVTRFGGRDRLKPQCAAWVGTWRRRHQWLDANRQVSAPNGR